MVERIHQRNIAGALLNADVTLADPARIDVRGGRACGRDATIDVGCIFEGRVELGDGMELYVFADRDSSFTESEDVHVIRLTDHAGALSPILHTIPLQLLAYYAAIVRGPDVDKPRNLAKSVTVE